MPTLQLLGGFALTDDAGAALPLPRKSRALLAFLALNQGRPVSREKLAALLWEDSSEVQARASLRQAIAAIRRVERGQPLILADAEQCALAPGVTVDALQLADADSAEARAAAFAGELLEGFTLSEAGFSAWLAAERAQLRDRAIEDLAASASAALAARRHEAAMAAARRLVALDPLHEAGHRLMMRAYAETGRPAEALRQYRALQALLRRDLGAAPEPETVALAQQLSRRRQAMVTEDRVEPESEAAAVAGAVEAAPGPVEPRRELRRIAVLSVGIAGIEALSAALDVERLEQVLASFHGMVAEVAAQGGGEILDRPADALTLLFGASHAHDDDPLRAARAAQAIHDRLAADADNALAASIGIAAGPVLVTGDGPSRTAVGEPLAIATRLRALAEPGATLVTGALLADLDGRFESTPLGDDGTHRLGAPVEGAAPPPLAGRVAELAQVEVLLDIVAEGPARTLIIRGEAGIGKTRLTEAAIETARGRGWRTLRAGIADFGELATITPRRQLMLDLLGMPADRPLPATLADHPLARNVPPEDLPVLYQLAGGTAPGRAGPATGIDEATRDRVFGLVLTVAAARSPLLIVVEDAHWAPADVLAQLQRFSRGLGPVPVLLLITTRPEPDWFDQAWRAGAGPLSTIDLAPLGRADALLVAEAVGVTDPDIADQLVTRAGGNPLFLRQLAAAVREGSEISEALPGSVQGLVLGRLDQLDAAERLALRAAALIGPRAELEAVRAIAGLPDYRPSSQALSALVRSDGHNLSFVHALVRDAVNAVTMPSERRALHLAAAAWYAPRNPALHARHLDSAGDAGAAAAWAAAADAELARHRPDKAQPLVEAGLAAASTAADRFRLHLVAARILMRQLDFDGAAQAARSAGAEAATDAERVQALVAEADAMTAAQAPDRALALLDAAAVLAEPAGLAEAMARILGLKGNIHFPRGDLAACLADHGAAAVWARRAGSRLAEAGALAGLGWAHYQRGAFGEARRHADDCLALATGDGFDRIRLAALRLRSVSRMFLLEHDGVLADAEAAIALAADQGDVQNEILARTTAATAHLECWNQAAAIAVIEPALALTQRIGTVGLEAAPLWALGTAHGALGDFAQARQHLEAARAAGMRGRAIRFAVPRILGTLAFFAAHAERAALVAEGERILAAMPVAHSANGLYGSALHAALAFGDHALADRCAAGLRRHQMGEAEPWVAAMLDFAQTFTALSRGERQHFAAAQQLHARARAEPALSWLRPTMRAVEQRIAAATGA